jgi:hypothetical protein
MAKKEKKKKTASRIKSTAGAKRRGSYKSRSKVKR